MNRAFDYNGTIVAPSHPVRKLNTVKKVVSIDSADRDTSKFYTNGDFFFEVPDYVAKDTNFYVLADLDCIALNSIVDQ